MTILVKKKGRKRSSIYAKNKENIGVVGSIMRETINIKDIQVGLKNLNLTCIVLDVGNPVIVAKNKREIRTVKVADATACINLGVWDEPGRHLNPGDIIRLTKVAASLYQNALTLYTTRHGTMQRIGEFCMVFNEQLNMSEVPDSVNTDTNDIATSNSINNISIVANGTGNDTFNNENGSNRYGSISKPTNAVSNITSCYTEPQSISIFSRCSSSKSLVKSNTVINGTNPSIISSNSSSILFSRTSTTSNIITSAESNNEVYFASPLTADVATSNDGALFHRDSGAYIVNNIADYMAGSDNEITVDNSAEVVIPYNGDSDYVEIDENNVQTNFDISGNTLDVVEIDDDDDNDFTYEDGLFQYAIEEDGTIKK